MRLIEDLLNILAPHACIGCGTEGSLLCSACAGGLARVPERCYRCRRLADDAAVCKPCRRHTPLRHVRAITPYEGVSKELIHKLKFERAKAGAATIANLLAANWPWGDDVLITYVPTAPTRVRQRGYDQAALIARAVARRVNRPCLALLARSGTARQVGQQRAVRKQQMAHALRPLQPALIQNRTIVLIDDVLTTGATCEAAARVLKQAGAAQVDALVFAVA